MADPILCPDSATLERLLAGELAPVEEGELNRHLEACHACGLRLDQLIDGAEVWSNLAPHRGEPMPPDEIDRDATIGRIIQDLKCPPDDVLGHDRNTAGETLAPESFAFLAPPIEPDALGRLAHYDVLELIGRGGMGIVFKAFDTSLRRVVAIKVLSPHLAGHPLARRRFVREAQAAAAVSHDHVVTIHAVEAGHEPPFLVMQFVQGKSLEQRIERSGPLQVNEILRIGLQTASGLTAAHAQGLVHRDIKPANILLENGVERVKISDFGLARAVDDVTITQSGVVTGTPEYMSPEQARGDAVDARTDLFSVGSVMYAMATGQAPFRSSTTLGLLRKVCDEAPRPIRDSNPDVPVWLVEIIEKLHAKDPSQRYQTAGEVADVLSERLVQLQQPRPRPSGAAKSIPAAPTTDSDEAPANAPPWRRWRIIIIVASVLILLGGFAAEMMGLTPWRQAVDLGPRSHGATSSGDVRTAESSKSPTGASPGITESSPQGLVATLPAFVGGAWGLAASPDGALLAAVGSDAANVWSVRVWDAETLPERLHVAEPHGLRAVAIAPDRQSLVTAEEDDCARLRDVRTGKVLAVFQGHSDDVTSVAITSDGRRLLTGSRDRTAGVWDIESRQELRRLRWHKDEIRSVAVSPDNRVAATASYDGTLKLWNLDSGELLHTCTPGRVGMECAAFSPDGAIVVCGDREGLVWLIHVQSGAELGVLKAHSAAVQAVAFAPHGAIATGSWDGGVYVWNLVTRFPSARLSAHANQVYGVTYLSAGTKIASAHRDGKIRIWSPAVQTRTGVD